MLSYGSLLLNFSTKVSSVHKELQFAVNINLTKEILSSTFSKNLLNLGLLLPNFMKIIQASNYTDLSRKAANIISAQVILNERSVLGLATGSTPIGTYQQLIDWYKKGDIDFSKITTFNLDEYVGLGKEDAQSYRHFMDDHFFSYINITPTSLHIPNGKAADMEAECTRYETLISDAGGIDLQLLGIGHNGHIGFNEPGDAFEKCTHLVALNNSTIQANARFFHSIDDVPTHAITMGIKTIMQAKKILLIANGLDKQNILEKALYGPVTPFVPASILQLHPDLTVIYCYEANASSSKNKESSC